MAAERAIHPISLLFILWIAAILFSWNAGQSEVVDDLWTDHQAQEHFKKNVNRFSNPLVWDDGRVIFCYEKNLLSFESNGTIAWAIPLDYTCNVDIDPVSDERGKIYLVADERVLKITPSNDGISKTSTEILLGPESISGRLGEIIGLSMSISSSSLFINIRNHGLFAYTLSGQLLWSTGPVLYRSGHRQGCKENITDCYFTSAPVVDQCEGSLYISNNEGLIYSVFVQSPNFKWVQDFSAFDRVRTITPGNNGRLYLGFPRMGIVMALDVSNGNVLWQKNSGSFCVRGCSPVVDANGWVSIGSMDGFLYSFSPNGFLKKFMLATAINSVVQVSPVLDCSGFAIYISRSTMEEKISHAVGEYTCISATKPTEVIVMLLSPAAGAVYWARKYPGELSSLLFESNLRNFAVDERILLAFVTSARMGEPFSCRTTSQKLSWSCSQAKPKYLSIYTGNEKTILLFLLFQFMVLVALAASIRFCCTFWRKKKLQDQDLAKFLEKRHSLRAKRKAFDKMIVELEKRAAEEAVANEALEQLGNVVKDKERIERKLLTTYSLGHDGPTSESQSLLPLYNGKSKSYSFQGRTRESVTIFDTLSDATSRERSDSSSSGNRWSNGSSCHREVSQQSSSDYETTENVAMGHMASEGGQSWESPASPMSGSRGYTNPLYNEHPFDDESSRVLMDGDDELVVGPVPLGSSRSVWLKRRKTKSSD